MRLSSQPCNIENSGPATVTAAVTTGDRGKAGPVEPSDGDRQRDGSSRRLRVVASVVVVAAIATLVAIRLTGDDGDRAGRSGGRSSTATTATAPTSTAVETFLDDPPTTATSRDLDGITFTDITDASGLAAPQSNLDLRADMSMTSGAAVADVDGDGDLDLYVTRVGLPNSLYLNDGDATFTDVAASAGVDRRPPDGGFQGSGAAAFADVDGDRCPDLYVAGAGDGTVSGDGALFVNDCAGHFTDRTAERGLTLPATTANLGAQGHGVTFADYDRDGHLDLLVLHWDPAFLGGNAGQQGFEQVPDPDSLCERMAVVRAAGSDRATVAGPNRSRLFRNDGTGHFVDVTAAVGLPLDRIAAFTGEFADVDGDGWDDLLIAGDFCTSALFLNDGGRTFTDATEAAGVATDENGMGSVVRDVDGDGAPDWFVTSIDGRTESGRCPTRSGNTGCSGNRLYLNRGDGTFDDATDRYGVRNGWWGWGAAIEDFGNDGRLAVAQTNGYVGDDPPRDRFVTDPMRFWIPGASKDLPLVDAAGPAGLDADGVGHALVAFDMDRDGDLDLFVANFGAAPVLYRNDTPTDRHWVTVSLDDPTRPGNRQGVGARVRVSSGDAEVTGWISTGGSYESQRPAELHVGLGDDDGPVDIEVWWPGTDTPQVVTASPVDRIVTVTRG